MHVVEAIEERWLRSREGSGETVACKKTHAHIIIDAFINKRLEIGAFIEFVRRIVSSKWGGGCGYVIVSPGRLLPARFTHGVSSNRNAALSVFSSAPGTGRLTSKMRDGYYTRTCYRRAREPSLLLSFCYYYCYWAVLLLLLLLLLLFECWPIGAHTSCVPPYYRRRRGCEYKNSRVCRIAAVDSHDKRTLPAIIIITLYLHTYTHYECPSVINALVPPFVVTTLCTGG